MKIGIADPQARVRYSLRILLEQQAGWEVTGEAADCEELLDLLRSVCPDLLLVDWDLPGMPMENLLPLLHVRFPGLRTVVLSGRQELSQIAVESGSDAFACKAESPEKLLNLIRVMQDRASRSSTTSGC